MQIALNMRRRKEHLSEANSFRYFLSDKVCINNLRKEKLDSLWRSTPWLHCCDCCQNIGDALDDHLFEVLLHRMFNFTHISGMYFFNYAQIWIFRFLYVRILKDLHICSSSGFVIQVLGNICAQDESGKSLILQVVLQNAMKFGFATSVIYPWRLIVSDNF